MPNKTDQTKAASCLLDLTAWKRYQQIRLEATGTGFDVPSISEILTAGFSAAVDKLEQEWRGKQ